MIRRVVRDGPVDDGLPKGTKAYAYRTALKAYGAQLPVVPGVTVSDAGGPAATT